MTESWEEWQIPQRAMQPVRETSKGGRDGQRGTSECEIQQSHVQSPEPGEE